MAVDSVERIDDTFERSNTGKAGVLTFRVTDSDPVTSEAATLATDGVTTIPTVNSAHPDLAAAKCRIVRAVSEKKPAMNVRVVTCSYTTESYSGGGSTEDDNPLNDPIRIRWGFASRQEILEFAAETSSDFTAGAAVKSTAGDPFNPPIMIDKYVLEVSITENIAASTPANLRLIQNSVNDGAVTIAGLSVDDRQGHMVEFSQESATRNEIDYWVQTMRVQIEEVDRTWDFSQLNWGPHYLHGGAAADQRPVLDAKNKKSAVPMKLAADGQQIFPPTADVFLAVRGYKQKSWAALNLDP